MKNADPTIQSLVERMVALGMEVNRVPAYLRNVANSISTDPHMSLDEINNSMESLGWDDFQLDDHTLRLILSTLSDDNISPLYHQLRRPGIRDFASISPEEEIQEHPRDP